MLLQFFYNQLILRSFSEQGPVIPPLKMEELPVQAWQKAVNGHIKRLEEALGEQPSGNGNNRLSQRQPAIIRRETHWGKHPQSRFLQAFCCSGK